MDKVINLGIPHVGELIFENIDTPGLIKCLEVSETWKVLAENVLIKRWKGKIFEACQNGETKVVQLLLERCNSEESGLNTKDEKERTAFMVACDNGHKDVVKLLLDHSGSNIDLNARTYDDDIIDELIPAVLDGWTAFMMACYEGHKDVVKLLLDHSDPKIDLNVRNNEGMTALMWACFEGHKDVVQLLLDHSDSNIDLNARIYAHMAIYMLRNFDEPEDAGQLILDHPDMFGINTGVIDGFTAFMIACSKGHKDVVQLLMDHSERIDLNARNTGWTAFTMACLFKRKDVVKLLLEYPEDIDINVPESFPLSQDIKDLIEFHSILELFVI